MTKWIFVLCAVHVLDFGFFGQEPQEKPVEEEIVETVEEEPVYQWSGQRLTKSAGMINGPTGIETYYNLPMEEHMAWIKSILGLDWEIWTRDDGCKMFGDYIMVAANLDHYPYGTIVQTSLGAGIVVDTGGFANWDGGWTWFDIATNW